MSENEKKKTDKPPLEVNVGEPIRVTDFSDVTVVESDLTVIVPGPDGKDEHLICDATCSSDFVADAVRKAMNILSDDSEWPGFQGRIEETVEIIRERGPEADGNIPVPTGWLQHVGFPAEIRPELRIKGGEKTTIRIIRTRTPENPRGSSKSDGGSDR